MDAKPHESSDRVPLPTKRLYQLVLTTEYIISTSSPLSVTNNVQEDGDKIKAPCIAARTP